MDNKDYFSLLLYYGRSRFYHLMQKAALDGLAKYPSESAFRLFNGIALILGNRVQEGIRELNPLKKEIELGLPALLALIYAHKRCRVVDRDVLVSLEQLLNRESCVLNANASYYSAVFLYLTCKSEKAYEYVEMTLKLDAQHEPGTVLKAWIQLTHKADVSVAVFRVFETILSRGKNMDALLGQVCYFQRCGLFDNAITALSKLSLRFPELNIPLILKMETQLAALDWEHAYETALRVINMEPANVAALRAKALMLITRESNIKACISTLQELLAATEVAEMGNYDLILKICQLFSRICSGNCEILSVTIRHVDKISPSISESVKFITELGYQWLMLCNNKEAEVKFRLAIKVDENCFNALCGLLLSEISEKGATEHIRRQIPFLAELCDKDQEPLLLFLKAKSAEHTALAVAYLVEATEIHFKKLENLVFGVEYLLLLNPDFMLQITSELLQNSPVQTCLQVDINLTRDTVHLTLKHSINILEAILRVCPANTQATFIRGKVDFFCGNFSTGALRLQHLITDIDSTYTDAYLLQTQIQIQQHQFTKAMQSLEMALSYNFSIRVNPMYHLLMGIILKQQLQLSEAQKSFLTAMQLVGSNFIGAEHRANEKRIFTDERSVNIHSGFTIYDKVILYLELINTYRQVEDSQGIYESERLLQYAMEEFNNTTEEGRFVIAHADIILNKCNISKAISLLTDIQLGQSYYIQAKTKLAHIYLRHRKNRLAFAKCFQDLVATSPETEGYLMLGDAYMFIQEQNLAVDAYQKAYNINPNDALLASKLGRAYVKTHQYAKAIKYYQDAIKKPDYSGLKLDLAELFLKLNQFQNAANTLTEDINQKRINEKDVIALKLRTKQLLLLARTHEKSGLISLSLETLQEARENQYQVQKRISVDQSENLHEQYNILSKYV